MLFSIEAKAKFSKEIKSSFPVNAQMIRKQSYFIADMEKYLVLEIEHQSLFQRRPLNLFNSLKAERSEEVAEGKS
jgi:hypothetical protein